MRGPWICRVAILCALAIPAFAAAGDKPASVDPPFYAPKDSLRGALHTLAIAPTRVLLSFPERDSVAARFDSLVASRLAGAGFQLIERGVYRELEKTISDSLGGLFDPSTGARDKDKTATMERRVREELAARHAINAVVFPILRSTPAEFSQSTARWWGASERLESRGLLKKAFGVAHKGTVGAAVLIIALEGPDGRVLYLDGGGIRVLSVIEKGKFVERPTAEVFGDAERNSKGVDLALKELLEIGPETK